MIFTFPTDVNVLADLAGNLIRLHKMHPLVNGWGCGKFLDAVLGIAAFEVHKDQIDFCQSLGIRADQTQDGIAFFSSDAVSTQKLFCILRIDKLRNFDFEFLDADKAMLFGLKFGVQPEK